MRIGDVLPQASESNYHNSTGGQIKGRKLRAIIKNSQYMSMNNEGTKFTINSWI